MRHSHRPFLFSAVAFLLAGAVSAQFGPQHQFACQGPNSIAVQDIDADGAIDLLVGTRSGMGVFRNIDGHGDFAAPVVVAANDTRGWLVDVNGDGLLDLISSLPLTPGIRMHRNMGQMVFADVETIAAMPAALDLGATDLDSDGDMDLFYTTDAGTVMVSYNTSGTGTFGAPVQIAELVGAAFPSAVDIDADGDPDIVFSSRVVNEVRACVNQVGTMDFPQQISTSGHGIMRDVDNDGLADVVAGNSASGRLVWQRNLGADQLAEPTVLDAAFEGPSVVNVSDLDGDGDLDAVATSSTLDEIVWFENTDGQGTYGPRQTVAFSVPGVYNFVTGDVDNDGDEDLFAASTELNKVIWYTNLATANGGMMGRVFNDLNGDGIFNGNDHGLAGIRVEASDVGVTYTNASGMYWYTATPGSYGVWLPELEGWELTTADNYELVVPPQGSAQYNDFGVRADGTVSTLVPVITTSPLRCAMTTSYWATVTNTGNQVSQVRLTLALDDVSTYVAADPAPDDVSNGVATWTFPQVQPTHQRQVHVRVLMPDAEHMGEILHDQVQAVALVGGEVLSTHVVPFEPQLTCAVDPNDKLAMPAGEGPQHLIPADQKLTYTIRFQNTGNAEAWTVSITDTLDASFDLSTVRFLGSSHVPHVVLRPDGILLATFENINLPDSATDLAGSQGYIRFSVSPKDARSEGTVVRNTVAIYFDNNAPVITNTVMHTLTYGAVGIDEALTSAPSSLRVMPNPLREGADVQVDRLFNGNADLHLFDATGRLVRRWKVRSNERVRLNAEGLGSGLYTLLLAVPGEPAERTRLIIE